MCSLCILKAALVDTNLSVVSSVRWGQEGRGYILQYSTRSLVPLPETNFQVLAILHKSMLGSHVGTGRKVRMLLEMSRAKNVCISFSPFTIFFIVAVQIKILC
jgi:hypothetical protein